MVSEDLSSTTALDHFCLQSYYRFGKSDQASLMNLQDVPLKNLPQIWGGPDGKAPGLKLPSSACLAALLTVLIINQEQLVTIINIHKLLTTIIYPSCRVRIGGIPWRSLDQTY